MRSQFFSILSPAAIFAVTDQRHWLLQAIGISELPKVGLEPTQACGHWILRASDSTPATALQHITSK
jgi:hypothetical protein